MTNRTAATLIVALATLLPIPMYGQEVRGSVDLETRIFPTSAEFFGQRDASVSPSLAVAPEILWDFSGGDLQLTFEPFVRIDTHDRDRTHIDIRQASALYFGSDWTVTAGIGRVFWGKTEAHHLVDVVNQTDGVEDIDTEDKLGQPMVSVTLERSWGALDLFYLPYFRERTFPGTKGRLRGPLPLLEDAEYESGAERWHPDVAARWSHFVGQLDIGVSAFRGTSREPRLTQEEGRTGQGLRPHYDIIDQLSVDAQWTVGPTLWKIEALTRGGHGDRFLASVLGVEHTFFGLADGATDLGVLVEVMLDGRTDDAPATPFDHDIFVGARWAANDEADSSLLAGPVVDLSTGETVAFAEAERRIAERWNAAIEARWILNTEAASPLSGLTRDDFLTIRFSRHF